MVLTGLRRELDQRVRILERFTAREWEAQLKRTSPVDTGNMRQKTTVRDRHPIIEAKADTDYAEYVRSGTRPHRIVGNPILSFVWHGQRVYFRSVNHPGTRPNSWWDDAIRDLPGHMQRIWAASPMIAQLDAFQIDLSDAVNVSSALCEVDRVTITAGEPQPQPAHVGRSGSGRAGSKMMMLSATAVLSARD